MFGTRTVFLVFGVLAFANIAIAASYTILADFVMTDTTLPHAPMTGRLACRYDTRNSDNNGLVIEYNVKGENAAPGTVTDYYCPKDKAVYSSCGNDCTTNSITITIDPWWKEGNVWVDTGRTEDGLKWYRNSGVTALVTEILMPESCSKTGNYNLKAIKLNDGRLFKLTNARFDSQYDYIFSKSDKCEGPRCTMYADVVVILDNSMSVQGNEWTNSLSFASKVLTNLTIKETAVAAAVVQFGAPKCGNYNGRNVTTSVKCNPSKWNSKSVTRHWQDDDYSCDSNPSNWGNKATLIVPSKTGANTVSYTEGDFANMETSVKRPEDGWTCAAFGLELTKRIFDESPRMGKNVSRIVILVTDGDDHCPNRTRIAAKTLRDPPYSATLVGVAVGLECEIDKNFIQELSSSLSGSKLYFDVNNYDEILTIPDKLMKPICEELHSSCDQECRGFCGCGKCWCPNSCEEIPNNGCQNYKCDVVGGTSNGCELSTKTCDPDTPCEKHSCQNENGVGKCVTTKTCAEMEGKYKGSCHRVNCTSDGKCVLDRRDSMCSRLEANGCEKWVCADVGETIDDPDTGCRLVRNITKECIDMSSGCAQYQCNAKEGKCVLKTPDPCAKESTNCSISSCNVNTHNCESRLTDPPAQDTACKTYKCDNAKGGWYISVDKTKDPQFCREELGVTDKICTEVGCRAEGGCYKNVDAECDGLCNTHYQTCLNGAKSKSKLDTCYATRCKVRNNPTSGVPEAYCVENVTNCLTSPEADEAERINANKPDSCVTIECDEGRCVQKFLPKPASNQCYEYKCKEDGHGGYHWVIQTTTVYNECKNDACTERKCVNETGCVDTDICQSKSNDCMTYKCLNDTDGKNKKCEGFSELRNYTCMEERCRENGTKYMYYKPLEEACPNSNKCEEVFCNVNGECERRNRTAPDEDPCKIWSCNKETGNFSSVPKCDDGIECTENKCTISGECRFVAVNCYDEVNMTGYPCFNAECKEGNGTHKCVRRLKPGVFIDVCGNCVGVSNGGSSDSGPELTACTDAPEEPILKEGLAAAAIAMIVVGVIIAGAALATSGIIGTKTLLDRANSAKNQSAHNNPLFEGEETEMTNPAYDGAV